LGRPPCKAYCKVIVVDIASSVLRGDVHFPATVTPRGSRGGKGLTQGEQPLGGRGSDTEPKYRVDPNNGCASGDERD
jgi:hypothetical protein